MIHEYLEMAWSFIWHPVVNHLLQSTSCIALAAFLAFVLRGNSARARYWIWLAASLKFLIPFSLFLQFGAHWARLLPSGGRQPYTIFIDYLGEQTGPRIAPLRALSSVSSESSIAAFILGLWLCGFAGIVGCWLWRWYQVKEELTNTADFPEGSERQTMLRLQQKVGVRFPVRLAASSFSRTPGVFGIFDPILRLPARISEHLKPAQLEAILAHEIVHIRRRDNLSAVLQMLVTAVFWFHPLVWWLGVKLIAERERACDEEVLRLGSDRETYAEGILRVCELCLRAQLPCVSGIAGSDLRRRVEQIMACRIGGGLTRAKKLLLTGAGAAMIVVPLCAGLLSAPPGFGQQRESDEHPSFAVASIKPSDANAQGIHLSFSPGGRFSASNVTLRFLIKIAYDLRDDQIGGGPGWLGSKRYDIEGKSDPPIPGSGKELQAQIRLRLQSLLADRFQLVLTQGSKELSGFVLVVARGGPKMREVPNAPAGEGSFRASNSRMEAKYTTMTVLARYLGETTQSVVLDATGLTGHYAFNLEFAPDPMINSGPAAANPDTPADATGPSVFTALQQQLGLKLETHKVPAEFVTVSRAEVPSAN
jgi:bla regulator protein blaR1